MSLCDLRPGRVRRPGRVVLRVGRRAAATPVLAATLLAAPGAMAGTTPVQPKMGEPLAGLTEEQLQRFLDGRTVHDLDIGPDGAVWVRAVDDVDRGPVSTYVITPEAMVAD